MTGGSSYPPLVYHYGGQKIPNYAFATMENVAKTWPAEVHLLHSSPDDVQIKGVIAENYSGWYLREPFRTVLAKTRMDGAFRDGFWLHAIERFFVLNQWLQIKSGSRFLHAELDVRLFSHHEIFARLDALGPAVYMPRASSQQAGANWMYCNDPASLQLIVDQFCERAGEGFEMQLLARFMDEFPQSIVAVPSHAAVETSDPSQVGFAAIGAGDLGLIVDVHPLGTWMLGQDRRNVPGEPVFNHFYYDELGSENLRNVRFHYSWRQDSLSVSFLGGQRFPLVALHVHSKIMRRAHCPIFLALYAWLANRRFRSLVIPQALGHYVASRLRAVRDKTYLRLKHTISRD